MLEKGGFYDRSSGDHTLKVLGLQWLPSLDGFAYTLTSQDLPCFKRHILSELARTFDSLGLLSPLLFFANHRDKWIRSKSELPHLSLLISHQLVKLNFLCCELHIFSESSELCYGAATYLRFCNPEKELQHMFLRSQ